MAAMMQMCPEKTTVLQYSLGLVDYLCFGFSIGSGQINPEFLDRLSVPKFKQDSFVFHWSYPSIVFFFLLSSYSVSFKCK